MSNYYGHRRPSAEMCFPCGEYEEIRPVQAYVPGTVQPGYPSVMRPPIIEPVPFIRPPVIVEQPVIVDPFVPIVPIIDPFPSHHHHHHGHHHGHHGHHHGHHGHH